MLGKMSLHGLSEPKLKDAVNLSEFTNGIAVEDQMFLKLMKKGTILVNGHYQIPPSSRSKSRSKVSKQQVTSKKTT